MPPVTREAGGTRQHTTETGLQDEGDAYHPLPMFPAKGESVIHITDDYPLEIAHLTAAGMRPLTRL